MANACGHDTRELDAVRDELDHIAQKAPHLPRRAAGAAQRTSFVRSVAGSS
ncbi:hypothetical protein [Paraburkholderia sp. PGU19]|uniref:hypothetical protein n=1 Tax=Paraburkholderia sp. PGU19 TaxID=2735434 RepID=UPI001FB103C1|nr:hypothetical protein [Paraburkholderia sp. PGU19]